VSDLPRAAPAPPDRFLLAIVLGALALIASAVAIVLVLGRTPASPPDPASPAGVVQAYVEALRAGDFDRARGYLSQSARAEIDRNREPFPRYYQPGGIERRVLIETVEVAEDHALVKVTISAFAARTEPFSSSTYHQEVNVRLVREGGQWRIAQPIEPFPFLA
jgi:hypothetical protein